MAIANNSGNIIGEYTYDAWGNTIAATGTWAAVNPLRYRGYFWDSETGYYWLQTRYYNPQWRRFLNMDVFAIAGNPLTAANMYGYCDNNPVMKVDPTGMVSIGQGIAAIGKGILVACFILADYLGVSQTLLLPYLQKFLDEEIFMFAAILYGEGGNSCSTAELMAIAWVVRNRVESDGYGFQNHNTYRDVITQKNGFYAYEHSNGHYKSAMNYLTGKKKYSSGLAPSTNKRNMLKCLRIALRVYFDVNTTDTMNGCLFYNGNNGYNPGSGFTLVTVPTNWDHQWWHRPI